MLAPLLVLAAIRVVVPPFEVDNAAPFVASRVTDLTVETVRTAGCADVVGPVELAEDGKKDFERCFGQHSCLASQTRALDAQVLVLGTLTKIADVHTVQLLVLDAASRRVVRSLRLKLPQKLNRLPEALRFAAEPLCRALQPAAPAVAAEAVKASDLPIEDIALTGFDGAPAVDETPAAEPPAPAIAETPPAPVPVAVVEAPRPPPVETPAPVVRPAPAPVVRPAPAPVARAAPVRPSVLAPTAPASPGLLERVPVPALVAFGAAAAMLVAGTAVGLGSRGISAGDQVAMVEGRPVHSITRAEAERANALAVGANVLFLGAAAAGGAGAYFVWTPPEKR